MIEYFKNIFSEFISFVSDQKLINIVIGFSIGLYFSNVSKSFGDNVLTPILNSLTPDEEKSLSIKLNKNNSIKVGNFLADLITAIIFLFIIFILFGGKNAEKYITTT